MRTERQRRGAAAEDEAATYLAGLGWSVVARNVKVDRDEIDVLAVDPGPPRTLVSVEVRGLRTVAFGAPEERVDRHKVARLYRSLARLASAAELDDAAASLLRRVDLVIVDWRRGGRQIRHLRSLEPP